MRQLVLLLDLQPCSWLDEACNVKRNAFGSAATCIVARFILLCCQSLVQRFHSQCTFLASEMHLIVAVRGCAFMQAMVESVVNDQTEGGHLA